MSFTRSIGVVVLSVLFRSNATAQFGPDIDPDPSGGKALHYRLAVDPGDERHWVGLADEAPGGVRWFTSFDAGATWSTGLLPTPNGAVEASVVINTDGSVLAIANDGFPNVLRPYLSSDGGLTWNQGAAVIANDALEPDLAIDLSGGPHHGRVAAAYVKWSGSKRESVYIRTSDDGGVRWSKTVGVFGALHQYNFNPSLAFGPGSELWVSCTSGRIKVNHSPDGGATFDGSQKVADYVPPALWDGVQAQDYFSIAVDTTSGPHAGTVYLAYHALDTTLGTSDIRCVSSPDGGATWNDVLVNQGDTTGADQILPRATVDRRGNLVVAFEDRRLDPANHLIWTWLATSADGGATFREYQLSDAGWDPWVLSTRGENSRYLGVVATELGVGALFPTETSGELDLRFDRANLALIATPGSISAAVGAPVQFDLALGPNDAGATYWLLGSLATAPPIVVGGVTIDLALDPLLLYLVQATNTAVFSNAAGVLDGEGRAIAVLDPQGPLPPALAGTDLFFAALISTPRPDHATVTLRVPIVP